MTFLLTLSLPLSQLNFVHNYVVWDAKQQPNLAHQQDAANETNMISLLSLLRRIHQTSKYRVIHLSWSARCEGAVVPDMQIQPAVRLGTHSLCTQYTCSVQKQPATNKSTPT